MAKQLHRFPGELAQAQRGPHRPAGLSLGRRAAVVIASIVSGLCATPSPAAPATQPAAEFARSVAFVQAHCVKCHGPEKQKGDVRLDDLSADMRRDGERWQQVRDQIRDGLMPPKKEPRPDEQQARALVAWIASSGAVQEARLPNQGNLIPHEALFGNAAGPVEPSAPRVWRLSPDGYMGFVRDVSRGRNGGLVQPFTLTPERGIRDYAGLYAIDEQSTNILLRNAETIVEAQTAHEIQDGKIRGKNDTVGEFVKLLDPALAPTPQQISAAIQLQHRLAIGRDAPQDVADRLLKLYETCAKDGDRPAALKTVLQAVLLRTDAMYRSELAAGAKPEAGGRRMLEPIELARAISLALGDRRDQAITTAAAKGELQTREQVAQHVRRMLDDPKFEKTRLLGFFRQYFEYHKVNDVFKERPADRIKHVPYVLVGDTDRLVLHILAQDKDVLKELLTTPLSFVNTTIKKNKQTRTDDLAPADVLPKPDPKREPEWKGGVETVYGVSEWPKEQPVKLPDQTRIGILMQPSWLGAWSTNFDNDPVRRGRWIRERLLGGNVPDLPIGVAAQVPDEKWRTFRDRLTVTRADSCWKCHSRMDELGLPFENFDHYGRFRTQEPVLDVEATKANVDKKGKPLGEVLKAAPLVTTGIIENSGDPALDGPVSDPRTMMHKLAASDRVRQVFVRHVFRYYLGRNETLSDARTLQEADRAYVQSGGSFKALLVSLLTSDSFLYRSNPSDNKPQAAAVPTGDQR